MCVWTKKRGSMSAVVLMASPCPKSLHGKGEKWIAQHLRLIFLNRLTLMLECRGRGES